MTVQAGIDILLASYNGGKYIEEQISSILSQTYGNFQLLVRDDGSSDDTPKILNHFEKKDKRIRLIRDNLGNLGFVSNFERLMQESDSELAMLSDQDDIWFPDKVERYVRRAGEEDIISPFLIHSDCIVCDEELRIIRKSYISSSAEGSNLQNMFFCFMVQGASMMFNRALKDMFLPFLPEAYLHDRYIHVMAELFGKRLFIPKTTMYYRQHGKNQIGSGSSIIDKILHKRYFDPRDRMLLMAVYDKYEGKMPEFAKKQFMAYLYITDRSRSRFRRMLEVYKSGITMNFNKKLFLTFKG